MPDPRITPRPTPHQLLAVVIALFCLALIALIGIEQPHLGAAGALVDFDAFYVVGLLIHEGRLGEAYHLPSMVAAYREFSGLESFMPWTYPPSFNLVAAALPVLPRGAAYILFTGGSFVAYAWMLYRLAGATAGLVMLALIPVMLMQLACGQNGFLTGALVGWFCLAVRDGRTGVAGVPLGLMAIKPHLGLALGIWALARGRWDTVGAAVATGMALFGLATLVLGLGAWADFRAGVAEAAGFLSAGQYPLFRMTSVYAGLHRLGLDPEVALAAQAAIGLAGCAGLVVAVRRGLGTRHALALACVATLMVSPYTYDYDLTILGVALALVAPELARHARRAEAVALGGLLWAAGGWGLVRSMMNIRLDPEAAQLVQNTAPSIGAPLVLAAAALVALILARGARRMPAAGAAVPG